MTDYSTWQKKKIKTTSLRLDSTNPRLTESHKTPSQSQIIDYLIDYEKAYELAKSIATEGYFPNESPFVCKENKKFVVLEGNRRVAACKILVNPDLIKGSTKRANIKKALKEFDISVIEKLDVIISPTRDDADVIIMNRHSGGAVVQKWDKTKQDRFVFNRVKAGESIEKLSEKFSFLSKSEIKKAIIRHNVYKEIVELPLPDDIIPLVQDEDKFSVTNIERLYSSGVGQEFLGMNFTSTGDVTKMLPKNEYEKRLSKVVVDFVKKKIDSRVLNTEDDRNSYVKKLIDSGDFDSEIKLDSKFNEEFKKNEEENLILEDQKENETKSTVRSLNRSISNKLFDTGIEIVSGHTRIDEIFLEIKGLSIVKNPNAISLLLRSYLDMLSYQFLLKTGTLNELKKQEGEKKGKEVEKKLKSICEYLIEHGLDESDIDEPKLKKKVKLSGGISTDWLPSLRHMLDFIASSDTLIPDIKIRLALRSYIGKDTKVIGHNEFNLLTHNESYTTSPNELKAVWDKLFHVIEHFANTLIDKK